MKREGFSNVSGIDPYIPETLNYKNGLTIQKKVLKDLNQDFDFIMLHHSFEHMPDPIRTLQELYHLTKPTGKVLIRIPIASSYAWRTFGTDWVALDAPRHFYLHTLKSMELLTQMSGFNIEKVVFDSFELQFWGSIQYQRDIPLMDPRSFQINKKNSIFSKNELNKFKENSVRLNNDKQGDAAGFYLTKM
jgi:predicted SAM-dependent methyltransferase